MFENPKALEVEFHIYVCRFFCAVLIHYVFQSEIEMALKQLKYLALHPEKFKMKLRAFEVCMMQFTVCLAVEICNIMCLIGLTDIKELIFNYLALAIIFEFDDIFVGIFTKTRITKFFGLELKQTRFRRTKKYYILVK